MYLGCRTSHLSCLKCYDALIYYLVFRETQFNADNFWHFLILFELKIYTEKVTAAPAPVGGARGLSPGKNLAPPAKGPAFGWSV
jgi:hypothetical protein